MKWEKLIYRLLLSMMFSWNDTDLVRRLAGMSFDALPSVFFRVDLSARFDFDNDEFEVKLRISRLESLSKITIGFLRDSTKE